MVMAAHVHGFDEDSFNTYTPCWKLQQSAKICVVQRRPLEMPITMILFYRNQILAETHGL